MAFELTDANFHEKVLSHKGVVMIDFWAEWCGPCRMVGPIVEEISKEYEGKAIVAKLDVDDNPEVSMRYGIRSIPTILFVKDGEIIDKHIGATTKAVLAKKLEEALVA
jgi:thioredoxin 1